MRRRGVRAALAQLMVTTFMPASNAAAQTTTTSAAARAFTDCREQEKVGDASACWTLWLSRYSKKGSEAEVAYAEEHARQRPTPPQSDPPGRLKLPPLDGVRFSIDGTAVDGAEPDGVALPPGEHTVEFVLDGEAMSRRVELKPGETVVLDIARPAHPGSPGRSAQNTAAISSPSPSRDPSDVRHVSGGVLDLCALAPKRGTGKFEKQRVVILAPADADQVEKDPALRSVEAGRVLREVFTARLPLERFHNVAVSIQADPAWLQRDSLTIEEVRTHLAAVASKAGGSSESPRALREQEFASYSLGCSDYVALPRITGHTAEWQESKVRQKQGDRTVEQTVKALALKVDGELSIYRRQGVTLRRIATVSASVPSLIDTMNDAAVAAIPQVEVGGVDVMRTATAAVEFPKHVSALPDVSCIVGKSPREGVASVASCATRGEGTIDQALGQLDERLGPTCRKARLSSTPASDRDRLILECEVRARAFQLARAIQKETRSVDGWKLFGVLSHSAGRPAMALGRDEGVRIGYGFEVRDVRNERIAFLKATDIGPGGSKGRTSPSLLSLRSGDAEDGARLEEYPQLGLSLSVLPSIGLLRLRTPGRSVWKDQDEIKYSLPSIVAGGGVAFGYDMSALVGWPETYLRLGVSLYAGEAANTSVLVIPTDLTFEKGFYLARRITLVSALGATVQWNSLRFKSAPAFDLPEDLNLSAMGVGPSARLGIDIMLHPDWSLRVESGARVPLNKAKYAEADGKEFPWWWRDRNDRLATLTANVGVVKTF